MFVRRVLADYEKNGLPSALVSYSSAETFEQFISIRMGTYDTRANKILLDMIRGAFAFTAGEIQSSLAQIENEEGVRMTINDASRLHEQIELISRVAWTETSEAPLQPWRKPKPVDGPISTTRAPKGYFNYVHSRATLKIESNDIDTALFWRMSLLVIDCIWHALNDSYDSYMITWLEKVTRSGGVLKTWVTNRQQSFYSQDEVTLLVKKSIEQLLDEQNMPIIMSHFTEYATNQWHHSDAVENYRQTGMLVVNNTLLQLITHENIIHLVKNIRIDVKINHRRQI